MDDVENKQARILFIPVTAQPPTFGLILSIMTVANEFDKIIICVYDNPIVLKTKAVLKMLRTILKEPKFKIMSSILDFSLITTIPTDVLPIFNNIATTCDKTYINLLSKGYFCYLLPKSIGYDELFHRNAYRQSCSLEMLRLKMITINMDNMNKTSGSTDEAGDN